MPNDTEKTGDRIAKVIARAGLASRREAEAWIAAGRVAVNGRVIASPALNVGPRDTVAVDGEPLRARERTRLYRYHKTRGTVTTNSDPEGRPTIYSVLPKHLPRLVSIGRLDLNTEGLLLLTNDGGLARVLELPKTAWLRQYRVRAFGRVTQEQLDRLRGGVTIDGMRYGGIEATLDREQGSNVWVTIGIREGKNREVRNVMQHLGLKVNRLIRIAFGAFSLENLAEGEIEEVATEDLVSLLGPEIIKEAEADFDSPLSAHDALPHRAAARREEMERRRDRDDKRNAGQRDRHQDHDADDAADTPRKPQKQKPRRRDRARSGPRPSRPKPSDKPQAHDKQAHGKQAHTKQAQGKKASTPKTPERD